MGDCWTEQSVISKILTKNPGEEQDKYVQSQLESQCFSSHLPFSLHSSVDQAMPEERQRLAE